MIPAYNAAATIARAIASVTTQSVCAAEIIVIDDGSRDETAAIARGAGATVVTQTNAGGGHARNAGMRLAREPWIALLDADDEWLPGKLEAQWRAVALRPEIGIVATDFTYVHTNGEREPCKMRTLRSYRTVRKTYLASDVAFVERNATALSFISAGFFVLPSTMLVSAALVAAGHLFRGRGELASTELFEEPEDFDWCLRLLRSSDVLVVERSLVTYHTQPASFTANQGRMRYGDAKLGERILAYPAQYPPGLAVAVAEVRPAKLRESAREFVRSGDLGRARTVLGAALREHRTPLDVALYGMLTLANNRVGRAGLELARSLWKRVLKPVLGPRRERHV